MKKYISLILIALFLLTTPAQALSTYTSVQVGHTPLPGYVLQTTGSESNWVSTSTLGISTIETDPLSLHLDQTTPQHVTGGTPSFDSGLADSSENLSVDTTARKLVYDDGTTASVDWGLGLLIEPTSENTTVDWIRGHLYSTAGVDNFDWENVAFPQLTTDGFLKVSGNQGYVSVDTSTYLTAEADTLDTVTGRGAITANIIGVGGINDNAGTPALSIDPNNRILYASDGTTPMLYWNTYDYVNIPNNLILDGGLIADNSNTPSVDPNNRVLYAADGTTAMLKYDSILGLYGGATSPVGLLNLATGVLSSYPSTTVDASVDWVNRILYASDGTTEVADWSSGALQINNVYSLPTTDSASDGQVLTGHADGTTTWENQATYDLTPYAKLDGTNQPFTGNIEISKADPDFRLTDTGGTTAYARLLKSDTLDKIDFKNRVQNYPVSTDQTPTMTWYNAPSGTVTRDRVEYNNNYAWQVFNNSTSGNAMWGDYPTQSFSITYQFATGKTCQSYSLTADATYNANMPTAWTVYGSNNGSTWTTLDSDSGGWSSGQKRTYLIDTPASYTYYKYTATGGGSGGYAVINEIEWLSTTPVYYEVNIAQSYNNQADATSLGIMRFGDYSTTFGTENYYDGKTHTFRILGTNKVSLNATGLYTPDSYKTVFGTGNDFEAYYTGTNMVFDPVLATSQIVFNESGTDTDFRIEGDTEANLFYADAGNGRIGIGTASPAYLFTVESSANTTAISAVKTTSAGALASANIVLNNNNSSGQIFKAGTGYTTYKTLKASDFGTYNNTAGDIVLLNDYASGKILMTAGGASTPHLSILSTGNVGIGTTAPSGKLDIQNGGLTFIGGADNTLETRTPNIAKVFRIGNYPYDNGAIPQGMLVANSGATDNILSIGGGSSAMYSSTYINFFTAANTTTVIGTERMRIDSSGNVKIPADSKYLYFGAGDDATITYDGTNMIINPKVVGSGYLSVTGAINAAANDIYTTGAVKGVHKAADGTAAVADGTYTIGKGLVTDGTITIKDGIITAIQQASNI